MDRACLYFVSYKVSRFVLGIRLGFGLSLGQDNPDPAKAGHRERFFAKYYNYICFFVESLVKWGYKEIVLSLPHLVPCLDGIRQQSISISDILLVAFH